jgi:hypothetical protein
MKLNDGFAKLCPVLFLDEGESIEWLKELSRRGE